MTITPHNMDLLTPAQAAAYLQWPESRVRGMANHGKLPHIGSGRYLRFSRIALDAWVAEQSAASVAVERVRLEIRTAPGMTRQTA